MYLLAVKNLQHDGQRMFVKCPMSTHMLYGGLSMRNLHLPLLFDGKKMTYILKMATRASVSALQATSPKTPTLCKRRSSVHQLWFCAYTGSINTFNIFLISFSA